MWDKEIILKLKNEFNNTDDNENVLKDENWERVYFKADKFKGSLRYTMKQKEAEDDRYPLLLKNLNTIEVQEEKSSDGYYHAKMVSEVRKNKENERRVENAEGSDGPRETGEIIAIIKASEKVTLQMIKISLEEA